jgi:hypothetical protein
LEFSGLLLSFLRDLVFPTAASLARNENQHIVPLNASGFGSSSSPVERIFDAGDFVDPSLTLYVFTSPDLTPRGRDFLYAVGSSQGAAARVISQIASSVWFCTWITFTKKSGIFAREKPRIP